MTRTVLLIGGDSTLGAALGSKLRTVGARVLETTRRIAPAEGRVHLDLSDGEIPEIGSDISTVFLCAAVTKLSACEADRVGTRLINVDNTLKVARHFAAKGAFVVGFSTNLVFDGTQQTCDVSHRMGPNTEYGRQKAALELGLAALGESAAVVRLSKVLHPDVALFRGWIADLRAARVIRPFSDMWMAPISLTATVTALAELAAASRSGVFQLSAESDISYADAGRALCAMVGAGSQLVVAEPAPQTLSPFLRPRYTAMDTTRAQRELGWVPVSAAATLREVFRQ